MLLNAMTVEDYLSLELPPLDTLYYNAYCMSNAVKYYDEEAKYYYHAVKTEQMKPLDWLRIVTSASYGNTDIVGILQSEASYLDAEQFEAEELLFQCGSHDQHPDR